MKDFNFIFGKYGFGKSTEAALRVKKYAEDLKRNKSPEKIYVLVPDQYTLSVEKFYMSLIGAELMVYVRVFSFKRFCRFIIEETFGTSDTVLGNVGRKILALTAVKKASPAFSFYPAGYKNVKFVNLITEIFRQFKGRGIPASRILEVSEAENNKKLRDISLAYAEYEEMFSGGYFDPDDVYTIAAKEIISSEIMRDVNIFADQFKTFNAKERAVLSALFESGASVTVTAVCDEKFSAEEEDPLWGVEKNIKYLIGKIKKLGGNIVSSRLETPFRFKTEEMRVLTENLFSESSEKYENIPENISVYRASDPFDEVENAAAEICRLVKNGYRYSDIVVTARDIDSYTGIIAPIFEEYEIPVFYHRKTPLKQKAPMTFILSVISAALDGYSAENVISAYKTGFLNAEDDAVALLESYFRKWPFAASSFEKPFKKNLSGFGSEKTPDGSEAEKLNILNNLRSYFIQTVSIFKAAGEKNTTENYARALYDVITFVGMPEKLEETAEFYKSFEEHGLYAEQLQVYDLIIKMLDEMVFVCGDKTVTLEDFRDVILSAAEESDIAILPTSLDRVVAGTVAMVPFMSQKAVFVLGCAEYTFPREISRDTLFTDEEIITLENYDIEIGKTVGEKINYEKFLFATAVSSVSEKCFISYPIKGMASSLESSYIGEIKNIFPLLSVEESPLYSGFSGTEKRITNLQTAFDFYSRTGDAKIKELFKDSKYSDYTEKGYTDSQTLSEEIAERLFGRDIRLSASKANLFSKCPFSYFIEYGLGVREERKAEINAVEFGNFMHKGLEKLLPVALETNSDIDGAVAEFAKNELEILLSGEEPTPSFSVHYGNVMRKLRRLLIKFREDAFSSDFKTEAYEKPVGVGENSLPAVKLPLSDNAFVSMVGIIDRVDVLSSEDRNYYRIVDYKSSKKTFSFERISNGIDMQLMMYLYAVLENAGKKALPGGVVYMNVNPTVVSLTRGEGKEDAEKKLKKEKGVSGLVLDDESVISALDKRNDEKNSPGAGIKAVSFSEFENTFGNIKEILTDIGTSLRHGKIPKSPLVNKDVDGCEYCVYKNFCENKKPPRSSRSGKEE